MLFTQDVSYARLMVLENTVEPSKNLDVSVQRREFAFNEGDVYFQAIDAADTLNLVACSTNEPVRLIPKLNQHAVLDLKACFILGGIGDKVDLDNIKTDGASFSSSQFFWVSGSVINNDFTAPYQALTYWPIEHIFEVSEPARFRVLEDEDIPAARKTSIGLRFMKEGDGYQLEPIYISDSAPSNTQHDPITIDASDTFPRKVTFQEAEIELLALTEDTLAYRILSGFSTDRRYILDLSQ